MRHPLDQERSSSEEHWTWQCLRVNLSTLLHLCEIRYFVVQLKSSLEEHWKGQYPYVDFPTFLLQPLGLLLILASTNYDCLSFQRTFPQVMFPGSITTWSKSNEMNILWNSDQICTSNGKRKSKRFCSTYLQISRTEKSNGPQKMKIR